MGSFSIWHWLIVLVIILLVFGTKKLRSLGSDLGGAVKGFKDGIKDGSGSMGGAANADSNAHAPTSASGSPITSQSQATHSGASAAAGPHGNPASATPGVVGPQASIRTIDVEVRERT